MTSKRIILTALVTAALAMTAAGQSLTMPSDASAGQAVAIPTSGRGNATLYVYGPGTAIKKKVELGETIQLDGSEVKKSGRYTVVLRGDQDSAGSFFVSPAGLENLAFLARPSRVPASRSGAVTGSAYLFDAYNNLVLEKYPVKFALSVDGAAAASRTQDSMNGVAWVRLDSGKKAGAAQFVASAGNASVKRIVQQTASDPCNIRMKAQPAKNGNILVETDPIRDCSGNPVPDGTIVTFISTDQNGRSTVDARIKRGFAQAELPPSQNATLSVAAGVVLGNEIHWGGR